MARHFSGIWMATTLLSCLLSRLAIRSDRLRKSAYVSVSSAGIVVRVQTQGFMQGVQGVQE